MNIEEAKKTVDKLSVCGGKIGDIPMVQAHTVKVLLDQLDQPKVVVPKFVAEWYEENKEGLWETVIDLIRVDERLMYKHANPPKAPSEEDKRFLEWLFREDDAFEILSDMHQFGYEVKKEKLYKVRDKRLSPDRNCLNFDKCSECWFFSNGVDTYSLIVKHTRKKLEESGFNVFDDDNYEVIEVAE